MINNTAKIIQTHINDILNQYPSVLELHFDNKDHILTVKFKYDLYEDWNKFLNSEYEFNIINVDLDKEIEPRDIKRLLLAKKFLRKYYKNNKNII